MNSCQHSFPQDRQRKEAWIRAIRRDDFLPSASSVVCVVHFAKKHVIEEDVITRDDGTILRVKRDRPKLIPDAIPTTFSGQPKYLTNPPSTFRGGVLWRESVFVNRDQKIMDEFMKTILSQILMYFRVDMEKNLTTTATKAGDFNLFMRVDIVSKSPV